MKKASCLVLLVLLLSGCATGLKREGLCLASLTPDFLAAQQELAVRESDWRAALARIDQRLTAPSSVPVQLSVRGVGSFPAGREFQPQAQRAVREAYDRLTGAKARHQATIQWYGRVYDRVRTRQEEEEILSQVRVVLVPGPGLLLYPVIHWNVHSVFWDGQDPDGETDRITQFCTKRLEAERRAEETRTADDPETERRNGEPFESAPRSEEESGGGTSP